MGDTWLLQIAEGLAQRRWSYGEGSSEEVKEEENSDIEMEEEELEDEEDEGSEEDDEDEEDPTIRLPSLSHINLNVLPSRSEIELPDYPIDDVESTMRRILQDFGYQCHEIIEKMIKWALSMPETARMCCKNDESMRRFLFGWESLEWRRRYFSKNEVKTYEQALLFKMFWDFNQVLKKLGHDGNFFLFDDQKLNNIPPSVQKTLMDIRHLPQLFSQNDLRLVIQKFKEKNARERISNQK